MKTITVKLSEDITDLELHIFADEHIGDPASDMNYLRERIEYVKNTPNAYAILNGDLMNNDTKTSVGDIYSSVMPPQEQMNTLEELFSPIKDKIICITLGNHEARTYKKEGIDVMYNMAKALDCLDKYSPTGAFIFLSFGQDNRERHTGRPMVYTIYCTHGSGSGRKEGAKAIRLADLASIVDADIYIHAHTHLPMAMKECYYRTNLVRKYVTSVVKLFVNSSANLNYGGYGETLGCKPSAKDKPVIYLSSGKEKNYSAKI